MDFEPDDDNHYTRSVAYNYKLPEKNVAWDKHVRRRIKN